MAKTIGKDKGSLTRTRTVADAETEPVGDPSNDEPRNEDMVLAEDVDQIENATDLNDETEAEESDFVVTPADTAVARRQQDASVSRTRSVPAPLMANPITRFIIESYFELRKVTWPTRAEAWNMTLIVIVMSVVIAAILGLADFGLVKLLSWFVGLGH